MCHDFLASRQANQLFNQDFVLLPLEATLANSLALKAANYFCLGDLNSVYELQRNKNTLVNTLEVRIKTVVDWNV